ALSIWSYDWKLPKYLVIAAVSVVLPWSTWPIVPMFTCGLLRSNFALAMVGSLRGPETGSGPPWPATSRRRVYPLRRQESSIRNPMQVDRWPSAGNDATQPQWGQTSPIQEQHMTRTTLAL